MEFPGILILAILWLVIGLPLSKLSQQAKKNAAKTQGGQQKQQQTPEAPQKPAAPAPEPLARESLLRPSISVTEHDDSVYQGSLNAVTGEGYDPCHNEQMAPLTAAESAPFGAPAEETPGMQLGWTGSDVVRGFVMGEILRRKGKAS